MKICLKLVKTDNAFLRLFIRIIQNYELNDLKILKIGSDEKNISVTKCFLNFLVIITYKNALGSNVYFMLCYCILNIVGYTVVEGNIFEKMSIG